MQTELDSLNFRSDSADIEKMSPIVRLFSVALLWAAGVFLLLEFPAGASNCGPKFAGLKIENLAKYPEIIKKLQSIEAKFLQVAKKNVEKEAVGGDPPLSAAEILEIRKREKIQVPRVSFVRKIRNFLTKKVVAEGDYKSGASDRAVRMFARNEAKIYAGEAKNLRVRLQAEEIIKNEALFRSLKARAQEILDGFGEGQKNLLRVDAVSVEQMLSGLAGVFSHSPGNARFDSEHLATFLASSTVEFFRNDLKNAIYPGFSALEAKMAITAQELAAESNGLKRPEALGALKSRGDAERALLKEKMVLVETENEKIKQRLIQHLQSLSIAGEKTGQLQLENPVRILSQQELAPLFVSFAKGKSVFEGASCCGNIGNKCGKCPFSLTILQMANHSPSMTKGFLPPLNFEVPYQDPVWQAMKELHDLGYDGWRHEERRMPASP